LNSNNSTPHLLRKHAKGPAAANDKVWQLALLCTNTAISQLPGELYAEVLTDKQPPHVNVNCCRCCMLLCLHCRQAQV